MNGYLCYHHNDMDGKGAANEVYLYMKNVLKIEPIPSMFIMRGYDEPFNEDDYKNKQVYIVDLSFTKKSIQKLFTICEGAAEVVWIDHHESSYDCIKNDDILNKLKSYSNLRFFVNKTACGALLTHSYLRGYFDSEDFEPEECTEWEVRWEDIKNMHSNIIISDPEGASTKYECTYLLKLIDLWDRWAYGDNINPVLFNYGAGLHNTSIFAYMRKEDTEKKYNSRFWTTMTMVNNIVKVIDEGRIAKRYFDTTSAKNVAACAYEVNILGHKALVLNSNGNSQVFGNKIDKYDLVVLWTYNGKTGLYQYSFFSADSSSVNCEKIAQHFDPNGGGHIHASGCSSDKLLFTKE